LINQSAKIFKSLKKSLKNWLGLDDEKKVWCR
jgi:hypothetical protein